LNSFFLTLGSAEKQEFHLCGVAKFKLSLPLSIDKKNGESRFFGEKKMSVGIVGR
jgi:hypothetical protein